MLEETFQGCTTGAPMAVSAKSKGETKLRSEVMLQEPVVVLVNVMWLGAEVGGLTNKLGTGRGLASYIHFPLTALARSWCGFERRSDNGWPGIELHHAERVLHV
jgi:hypothetical protein